MRRLIFPALILVPVLVFSCKGKEGQIPFDAAAFDETAPAEDISGDWETGYVIRVNGSFYTVANDTGEATDRTTYAAAMSLGERVLVGEVRRLTFAGDGTVYDFVNVRRFDGSEGYGFAAQITRGGELAVVIDERGNMYGTARTIDVTGITLPRRTVVVRFPETEEDGFVEVRAYDPAVQVYRQNYMRTSSLSLRQTDIQSSILLQTAEPLGNTGTEKIRKDALLESALLDYPDSVFNAEIMAIVNPNAAVAVQTEQIRGGLFLTVIDNNVNIRDIPDAVAGRVVGQLSRGDEVMAAEQTTNYSTVGGATARWFLISGPVQGWVFGAFLEESF